jgi:hypothetical protein
MIGKKWATCEACGARVSLEGFDREGEPIWYGGPDPGRPRYCHESLTGLHVADERFGRVT